MSGCERVEREGGTWACSGGGGGGSRGTINGLSGVQRQQGQQGRSKTSLTGAFKARNPPSVLTEQLCRQAAYPDWLLEVTG